MTPEISDFLLPGGLIVQLVIGYYALRFNLRSLADKQDSNMVLLKVQMDKLTQETQKQGERLDNLYDKLNDLTMEQARIDEEMRVTRPWRNSRDP